METSKEKISRNQTIERDVLSVSEKTGSWYWLLLFFTVCLTALGFIMWGNQILTGMGLAGKNNPVGWRFYITNFVFWVGIAHSGTLISAVLLLFRARFRSSFNRAAEAMTVFAVMTAGLFPLIHLGRAWKFYWLFPYPNQRLLWVNFKSPLIWDVFAVSTYFTVSVVFFYVGMIPDLAVARKHSLGIKKLFYSILSLGWQGTELQWKHYRWLCIFLAAFATPLVVSVHSVVSWDFAMSLIPGWHTTIFAPYFVSGAIFSGTAMVITLVVPMRKIFSLEKYITEDHFENIAKILIVTSLIVGYAYIVEPLLAIYSGNIFEKSQFYYRFFGEHWFAAGIMLTCNAILPATLFVKKLRRNIKYLFIMSIFVNIGMWLERYVIIVTSLSHDYDPYAWGTWFKPTYTELGITIGSFGLFFTLYLLFIKFLPILSISEIKEVSE